MKKKDKPDIMDEAIQSKAKNTTMFEVADSEDDKQVPVGRYRNRYDGTAYLKQFIEFIESLGYEISEGKSIHSSTIEIKGVSFEIVTKNASYYSYNPYGRKWSVRKPENRFITLSRGSYRNTYVIKVHFNKEIDADRMRKNIDKAIEEHFAVIKKNQQFKIAQEENTTKIAMHFLDNITSEIEKNIKYIHIDNGEISFSLQRGSVTIKADGTFKQGTFTLSNIEKVADIKKQTEEIKTSYPAYVQAVVSISHVAKLPEDLVKWATEARYKQFDVGKMKVIE